MQGLFLGEKKVRAEGVLIITLSNSALVKLGMRVSLPRFVKTLILWMSQMPEQL